MTKVIKLTEVIQPSVIYMRLNEMRRIVDFWFFSLQLDGPQLGKTKACFAALTNFGPFFSVNFK